MCILCRQPLADLRVLMKGKLSLWMPPCRLNGDTDMPDLPESAPAAHSGETPEAANSMNEEQPSATPTAAEQEAESGESPSLLSYLCSLSALLYRTLSDFLLPVPALIFTAVSRCLGIRVVDIAG